MMQALLCQWLFPGICPPRVVVADSAVVRSVGGRAERPGALREVSESPSR